MRVACKQHRRTSAATAHPIELPGTRARANCPHPVHRPANRIRERIPSFCGRSEVTCLVYSPSTCASHTKLRAGNLAMPQRRVWTLQSRDRFARICRVPQEAPLASARCWQMESTSGDPDIFKKFES